MDTWDDCLDVVHKIQIGLSGVAAPHLHKKKYIKQWNYLILGGGGGEIYITAAKNV